MTASKWIERLEKIENPRLRIKLARIVWWDFFSSERVSNRISPFAKYVWNMSWDIPRETIINGLIQIGYSAYDAKRRVSKCR